MSRPLAEVTGQFHVSVSLWLHVSPLFRAGSPCSCPSALLADREACVLACALPASVVVNEENTGREETCTWGASL